MAEASFRITISIDPEDIPQATKSSTSIDNPDVDTSLISGSLIKAEPEQRFTLCVGYPARRADISTAADGFRDWASERACEKAAWEYLRKSPKVGLWHEREGKTEGIAEVVESYIYRPDTPWEITAADGSTQTICKGDWLIGLVWTEAGWDLIKSGEVRGISPQGRARRRASDPADLATLRS